jgi:predicted Rdx family selenoprotein
MKINIQKILDVYYRAMLASYFGTKQNDNVMTVKNNDQTVTTYREGDDFIAIDSYSETGGKTEIFYQGELVWEMTYSGNYPRNTIPTLMSAIKANLEKKIFMGGRGPERFDNDIYVYENNIESNDPMNFRGIEKIYVPGPVIEPVILGYHQYSGKAVSDLVEA